MKGILFQPWKIKAIVASHDKEWQTRRLMQNQPTEMDKCYETAFKKDFGGRVPRYHINETVYIKEAHHFHKTATEIIDGVKHPIVFYKDRDTILSTSQWRNPRTMPAWAARYFIKITRVAACRIKNISFEDCLAEGVVDCPFWQNLDYKAPEPLHPDNLSNDEADKEIDRGWIEYARQAYFALWEDINGKGSLSSNPWVWKYTFVIVDKPT